MTTREEDRQCDFGQYEELWKSHITSCKKIIRITSDYIVHIDKRNNIDWETTEEFDKSKTEEEGRLKEKIFSKCLIAEHKPTAGLDEETIVSFKTIVGEAIVNCLEGNCEDAVEILKQADEFRLDRVVEKSREWYLSFTVLISLIFIAIIILVNNISTAFTNESLEHICIGAWAIAGACLSIILRSGRLQHASYAGRYLHFIESGCRLIGGFISGQIVYLGIKSGVIFSTLTHADNASYIISFLALLAGASERFAPSIITKIEESSIITEPKKENQIGVT